MLGGCGVDETLIASGGGLIPLFLVRKVHATLFLVRKLKFRDNREIDRQIINYDYRKKTEQLSAFIGLSSSARRSSIN